MANSNPPKKNQAFTTRIGLYDAAATGTLKNTPTISSGDFLVAVDATAFTTLGTLPTVSPTGTSAVLLSLSAAEMNGDVITITAIDQTTPKEWTDYMLVINTTT